MIPLATRPAEVNLMISFTAATRTPRPLFATRWQDEKVLNHGPAVDSDPGNEYDNEHGLDLPTLSTPQSAADSTPCPPPQPLCKSLTQQTRQLHGRESTHTNPDDAETLL